MILNYSYEYKMCATEFYAIVKSKIYSKNDISMVKKSTTRLTAKSINNKHAGAQYPCPNPVIEGKRAIS